MSKGNRGNFEESGTTLYDTVMVGIYVIIHLSKLIGYATPRVNPNLSYGLRVKMMSRGWSISGNKCIILVGVADSRGGCV